MVLQADKPVSVWGWAEKGTTIEVTFGESAVQTKADQNGKWKTQLPTMPKSFQPRSLIIHSDKQRIEFKDVLVGEVWLCGGQSNMAWTLNSSRDSDLEIASANTAHIRFIRVPLISRGNPQTNFAVTSPQAREGNWRMATSEQVENCTAVGYYFAHRISRLLNTPIGLIDVSWGGTMAQHWVSEQTLSSIPEMQPYHDDYQQALASWNAGGGETGAQKRYSMDLAAWEAAVKSAKDNGTKEPRRPNPTDYQDPSHKRHPSGMINGMIYPISRMSVRGVLFYQGENNSFGTSWKPFYATYPAVIRDWRVLFDDPNLPFGLVQIAGWSNRRSMTYDMNHHTNVIRELQHLTWQQTGNTGLVSSYDTNSNGSIHPSHKRPVGERLARWALSEVYQEQIGRQIAWQGPLYQSHVIKDNKITISFQEETAKGLRLNKDLVAGFYIAAQDRVFQHAKARIAGQNVVVWHDDIKEPVAVRYGFSNLPHGTLLNGKELPAYPFRTDPWPITPHQSTGDYDILNTPPVTPSAKE